MQSITFDLSCVSIMSGFIYGTFILCPLTQRLDFFLPHVWQRLRILPTGKASLHFSKGWLLGCQYISKLACPSFHFSMPSFSSTSLYPAELSRTLSWGGSNKVTASASSFCLYEVGCQFLCVFSLPLQRETQHSLQFKGSPLILRSRYGHCRGSRIVVLHGWS